VKNCAGLATLAWAGAAVEPGSRVSCFGHFGDGNIHFSVPQPTSADKSAFLARRDAINDVVHAIAARMGGSFSAEHGGEQLKLRRRKTRVRSRSSFFNASASGVSASSHRSTSAGMVRISAVVWTQFYSKSAYREA
jgi:FAD linked oxidases, C-terminal domain